MQNRGAITVFAVILALVCLYQLSFTYVSRNVTKQAQEYAQGDKQKFRNYIDSIESKTVYDIGITQFTYKEVQDRELNLGLDLKGGMNVTLEVSVSDLLKALSNNSKNPVFNAALDSASARQKSSTQDFVTLFAEAFNEIDPDASLAAPDIFGYTMRERLSENPTNEEVIGIIREEVQKAIDSTFDVLRSRIDKFGVTQPNIQRLENSDRILVELPGIKEPERARKLLQSTAKLEFWETYENSELQQNFSRANEILKKQIDAEKIKKDTIEVEQEEALEELQAEVEPAGEEETAEPEEEDPLADLLEDEDTTDLLDEIGEDTSAAAAEADFAEFAKENPLYAVLRPAVYENQQGQYVPTPGPAVGYAQIKDTAKVNDYMSRPQVRAVFPRNVKFLWTHKPFDEGESTLQLVAIKVNDRDGNAPLEGDVIVNAKQDFGQFGGKPEITMNMNNEGANKWRKLTANNIGRSIAIVLDDQVYSFPTVQGEISGGRSSITGDFTIKEAQLLATILEAGKLPAPAKIVEEAVVGPSLGREAIQSGLNSFLVAIALVLVFMIFYYSGAGLVANIALIANVFFVFGVLASLGAVLTLPGIAGIVLTIGISIDSNVLIFERIREELSKGSGLRLAISQGYNHAYSAIIDANATTLLTGIILYIFGTGPIQGFATTLIIGIFCSLFSAIFITRIIFDWQLSRDKMIKYANKITEGAFKGMGIDFISKRKFFYTLSSLVIIAGIVSMLTRGFNMGVDFLGGRSFVVQFDQRVDIQDVTASLSEAFEGQSPNVKTFGSPDRLKIVTAYKIDDESIEATQEVDRKLYEGLKPYYEKDITFDEFSTLREDKPLGKQSSQKVGPTIADDIKVSAVWSVIFSMIVIFIYILVRFRRWQFSLGAVAAIFHDVLVVLGCFSLLYGVLPFSLEVDQAFIAAMLTVIGYSINDTVVVFDRIREYQKEHPLRAKNLNRVINDALNSTMSRTIITSVTTFIVLLVLFLAGGETIRGFSFALLIGVLVGTYSSVFIATPVVLEFYKKGDFADTEDDNK